MSLLALHKCEPPDVMERYCMRTVTPPEEADQKSEDFHLINKYFSSYFKRNRMFDVTLGFPTVPF